MAAASEPGDRAPDVDDRDVDQALQRLDDRSDVARWLGWCGTGCCGLGMAMVVPLGEVGAGAFGIGYVMLWGSFFLGGITGWALLPLPLAAAVHGTLQLPILTASTEATALWLAAGIAQVLLVPAEAKLRRREARAMARHFVRRKHRIRRRLASHDSGGVAADGGRTEPSSDASPSSRTTRRRGGVQELAAARRARKAAADRTDG